MALSQLDLIQQALSGPIRAQLGPMTSGLDESVARALSTRMMQMVAAASSQQHAYAGTRGLREAIGGTARRVASATDAVPPNFGRNLPALYRGGGPEQALLEGFVPKPGLWSSLKETAFPKLGGLGWKEALKSAGGAASVWLPLYMAAAPWLRILGDKLIGADPESLTKLQLDMGNVGASSLESVPSEEWMMYQMLLPALGLQPPQQQSTTTSGAGSGGGNPLLEMMMGGAAKRRGLAPGEQPIPM